MRRQHCCAGYQLSVWDVWKGSDCIVNLHVQKYRGIDNRIYRPYIIDNNYIGISSRVVTGELFHFFLFYPRQLCRRGYVFWFAYLSVCAYARCWIWITIVYSIAGGYCSSPVEEVKFWTSPLVGSKIRRVGWDVTADLPHLTQCCELSSQRHLSVQSDTCTVLKFI